MKDILLDGGLYFNPNEPDSIANSIKKIIDSAPEKNLELAEKAHLISQNYSWKITANKTFNFLNQICKSNSR